MHTETGATRLDLPILCLEDDAHLGRMLGRVYPARAIEVVRTAAQARARIDRCIYAAWMLDVKVPDGSGLDVLAWARTRGDQTPALVVTGMIDDRLGRRAADLGAEFMFKPYAKSKLDDFIERADAARSDVAELVRSFDALAGATVVPAREIEELFALADGVRRAGLAGRLGVAESTLEATILTLLRRTDHADIEDVVRMLVRRVHHLDS